MGLILITVLGMALWAVQWHLSGGMDPGAPAHGESRAPPPPLRDDWPLWALAVVITVWVGQLQFALGPYIQNLTGVDSVTASQWTGITLMAGSVVAMVIGPLGNRVLGERLHILCGLWILTFTLGGLLLALAPDLSMLGYLAGPRIGAATYNVVHTYALPVLLGGFGAWTESPLLIQVALVWAAHIGADRVAGYGLKYPTGFKYTHLSAHSDHRSTGPDVTDVIPDDIARSGD